MAIDGDSPDSTVPVPAVQVPPARWLRRPRRRTVAVIVAVLALALVGDWWETNREMDQLLTNALNSNAAIAKGNTEVPGALASYNSSTDRQSQARYLQAACSDAATPVQVAGVTMDDELILPWHVSLNKAKARYLDYSGAFLRLFRACASDPAKVDYQVIVSEIKATSQLAHTAFNDAVPFHPLNDAPARITGIFGT